jgi:hypothetical protein
VFLFRVTHYLGVKYGFRMKGKKRRIRAESPRSALRERKEGKNIVLTLEDSV